MSILFDTNIIFSAFVAEGNEKYFLEKAVVNNHTIVITDFIAEEIEKVFSKKLSKPRAEKAKKIFSVFQKSKFVYVKKRNKYQEFLGGSKQLINKKDSPILAAVLQPEIDVMVSGDKDFTENPKLKFLRHKKIFTTKEALGLI